MPDTRRSTGAGDFYGAIWTPAGPIASGDQLIINHAVTWTPNTSTMWLGSGVNHSIAFGTAGKLTVTPTGTFNLTLAGAVGSGNISQFEFVADSTSGTINICFDATGNSTGFPMAVGDSYDLNNRGGWDLCGNITYPINVFSLPTNGTKNSYFTASQPGGGNVNANYVNFSRIGTTTTRSFIPQCTNLRNPTVNMTNVTLSGCGEYFFNGDATYTGVVNFRNVKWIDPKVDNTTYYVLNATFASYGTPRYFSGCVIPTVVKLVAPRSILFENCVIESGLLTTSTNARWSGIDRCFIHALGSYTVSPFAVSGPITRSVFYWDSPADPNHHFFSLATTTPTGEYTLWSGNVFYSNTYASDSNCMLSPGVSSDIDVVGNLVLPNASGGTGGALFTSTARVWATGLCKIRNNTANVAGQWGLEVGHLMGPDVSNITQVSGTYTVSTPVPYGDHGYKTGDVITITEVGGITSANGTWTITRTGANSFTFTGPVTANTYTSGGETWCRENPNRYAQVYNNIFWGSGAGFCGRNTHSTSYRDIIPPSSIQKNVSFAINAVDSNVTIAALFSGQANGWCMSFSSTPGSTDLTNTDPQFANSGVSLSMWATTKGSVSSSWWAKEQDAVGYIKNDVNLIDDLRTFLQSGFTPRNQSIATAGVGGLHIGAFPVQASSSAKPRFTFIKNGGGLTTHLKTGGSLN